MAENPILRQQKLTILQQIDELKNWHRQQQSKLNYGSESIEQINCSDKSNNKQNPANNNSKYAINSESNKHYQIDKNAMDNFDETPVKGIQSNSLIENNNPTHGNTQNHTNNNNAKPKFRFLKKGEGIARFRMGPVKIQKPKNSNKLNLHQSSSSKISLQKNEEQFHKPESKVGVEKMQLLQPPDLKLNFKNWKSVFNEGNAIKVIEQAIDNNQLEIFQPNCSIDSSTASIMERILTVSRKHLKEREEMRVFETIEQHILDSSFCSTSSYVTKLMENAVMSTPEKSTTSNYEDEKSNNIKLYENVVNEKPMENSEQKVVKEQSKLEKIPICTKASEDEKAGKKLSTDSTKLEESLHVRFNDEVDFKSFIENSQALGSSREQEISNSEPFEDSEEWKDDTSESSVCCSKCGSECGSLEEDSRNSRLISPPPVGNQNRVNGEQSDTQHSVQRPADKLDIKDLMTDDYPNSGTKASVEKDIEMFSPILNAKLKELENEIETFRTENNKLKLIRDKLEKEHKQFQLEKKKILKEVEEERKKNVAQIDEEKQKLLKEKFIFEKYSKTLTKNPSKEERKELQALREQLSEMKDELNKKESRWGAAQARVRNQVKLLEEDNKKLREEIEILRKQSRSLQILTQKKNRKPLNNTKLIHAINDHISKIGPVADVNVNLECGYFNSNSDGVKAVTIEDVDPKSANVKVVKGNVQNAPIPTYNKSQDKLVQSQQRHNTSGEKSSTKIDILSSKQVTCEESFGYLNNKSSNNEVGSHEAEVQSKSPLAENVLKTNVIKEITNEDGSIEKTHPDGKKEIRFKNGNVKKIDPIIGYEKTIYFNGDVKETTSNGTTKYYFAESRIWHTKLPDGLEVLDFPDGQVEKRHTNGTVEIIYPSDCKKITYPDGLEEIFYADGTNIKIEGSKRKVLSLPNGQKEIHTDECVRREYPDGTVKIVYPDGTTETVYSNGRVRLKDKHGNLVMDSGTAAPIKL